MSGRATPNLLERLENLYKLSEERKSRARARMERDKSEKWCLGILGLKTNIVEYQIKDNLKIRKVEEPPGELDLLSALKDKTLIGAIGRYSARINYELVFDRRRGSEGNKIAALAWNAISSLRVISQADFLVPIVANRSWSVISGSPENSCLAALLEDIPKAFKFGGPVIIDKLHFDWVNRNLDEFSIQMNDARFEMAIQALTEHQQQSSFRLSTAALWSGIEALFGINTELRFRLSSVVSSYLEERGLNRISLYNDFKHQYDVRSKAVHGSTISDEELSNHIIWTRSLLARIIIKIVEQKNFPTAHEFEKFLFT